MIKTEYYGRFKRYRPVALRWTNIFMAKFILRMNLIKILVFCGKEVVSKQNMAFPLIREVYFTVIMASIHKEILL
jgi:hypothetical protein